MRNIVNTDEDIKERFSMLVADLYSIAEALGVKEEGFGVTGAGIAPSRILEAIKELQTN